VGRSILQVRDAEVVGGMDFGNIQGHNRRARQPTLNPGNIIMELLDGL
jgi:hypothetical protein